MDWQARAVRFYKALNILYNFDVLRLLLTNHLFCLFEVAVNSNFSWTVCDKNISIKKTFLSCDKSFFFLYREVSSSFTSQIGDTLQSVGFVS